MATNILYKTNVALMNKTFADGLSYYSQANCSCTLTDIGYRIYRDPNLTVSGNGRVMWGGLVIRPFNADANALVKGHTYILKFEYKGKTSNEVRTEVYWTNNCGWGGGGLEPQPSDVGFTSVPANFQSDDWQPFQYKWTINDDIVKTCTTSYSSFVAGQQYTSYRDFKWGFGYTDTGALGTDLYVKNIRMYDITTHDNPIRITKQGIVYAGNFDESGNKMQMCAEGDLITTEFIEI